MINNIIDMTLNCTHYCIANNESHEAQQKLLKINTDNPFDVIYMDI